ncbi:MAG: hypothetical protein ACT4PT_09045 [Methanobacteriota archaeon]
MVVQKLSVSLTEEARRALDRIVAARGEERSPVLEMLVREHPLVAREIEAMRAEPRPGKVAPGTTKGRDVEKLLVLAEVAAKAWERRIASGEVKVHVLDR